MSMYPSAAALTASNSLSMLPEPVAAAGKELQKNATCNRILHSNYIMRHQQRVCTSSQKHFTLLRTGLKQSRHTQHTTRCAGRTAQRGVSAAAAHVHCTKCAPTFPTSLDVCMKSSSRVLLRVSSRCRTSSGGRSSRPGTRIASAP